LDCAAELVWVCDCTVAVIGLFARLTPLAAIGAGPKWLGLPSEVSAVLASTHSWLAHRTDPVAVIADTSFLAFLVIAGYYLDGKAAPAALIAAGWL
jgi:hypothetical protein